MIDMSELDVAHVEAEAGKDRLEEECTRLRADQAKYHQNSWSAMVNFRWMEP